ncbi:MAG: NPCBM/NEW2 domain-containing protein [Thermoguttaceae bacterium]
MGKVKIGANPNHTWGGATMNAFANILYTFAGNIREDGVGLRDDTVMWFPGGKESLEGLWPESTDDPATWYKLIYHCDSDALKERFAFPDGRFTYVKAPARDGHGNWTAWLKYKELWNDRNCEIRMHFAPAELDVKGFSKFPVTKLKLLYPGSKDDDFLSPIFKKRAAGFARFRFLDPMNMNGRQCFYTCEVPSAPDSEFARRALSIPGKKPAVFKVNRAFGGGAGKDREFVRWDGQKYSSPDPIGIGCLAPCELEYKLDGRFAFVSAEVGVDHEVDGGAGTPHGNVTFQVWGAKSPDPQSKDYTLLAEYKNLTSRTPVTRVVVDMTGLQRMKFVVLGKGEPYDHVDIV